MTANGARNRGLVDVGVLANEPNEILRFDASARIQLEYTGLARERDALEDLLGGLRPKATDLGEPAVARRLLQLRDIGDLELLVDLVNLLGRKPRNGEQVEEAFRRRFA